MPTRFPRRVSATEHSCAITSTTPVESVTNVSGQAEAILAAHQIRQNLLPSTQEIPVIVEATQNFGDGRYYAQSVITKGESYAVMYNTETRSFVVKLDDGRFFGTCYLFNGWKLIDVISNNPKDVMRVLISMVVRSYHFVTATHFTEKGQRGYFKQCEPFNIRK